MSGKQTQGYDRRRFLQGMAAVGGTGAVLSLTTAAESDATAVAAGPVRDGTSTSQGYRLSAHIRAYYDSARS